MISAYLKLLRIAVHVLAGTLTVWLVFPRLSAAERLARVRCWAHGLLAILKVEVVSNGRPAGAAGALMVANHVSWMDVYLLFSLAPTHFISKAEVRGWPLIGWLATAAGTLFLARDRKSDAMRVNRMMAEHLRAGDCLALFPEGTTTDGSVLLPFYASLFQPAVEAGVPVWPAHIRYLTPAGAPCVAAAYCGEVSLGQSLRRIIREPGIRAEVHFLPPIASQGMTRRELARAVEAAIRTRHEAGFSAACVAPGSAPAGSARLPA